MDMASNRYAMISIFRYSRNSVGTIDRLMDVLLRARWSLGGFGDLQTLHRHARPSLRCGSNAALCISVTVAEIERFHLHIIIAVTVCTRLLDGLPTITRSSEFDYIARRLYKAAGSCEVALLFPVFHPHSEVRFIQRLEGASRGTTILQSSCRKCEGTYGPVGCGFNALKEAQHFEGRLVKQSIYETGHDTRTHNSLNSLTCCSLGCSL